MKPLFQKGLYLHGLISDIIQKHSIAGAVLFQFSYFRESYEACRVKSERRLMKYAGLKQIQMETWNIQFKTTRSGGWGCRAAGAQWDESSVWRKQTWGEPRAEKLPECYLQNENGSWTQAELHDINLDPRSFYFSLNKNYHIICVKINSIKILK